jgi:hemerythrin superfamily protein
MDILELIRRDHRQVETLFLQLGSTNEDTELYQCFNQIYQELNLHTEAEEQVFYPALRECEGTEDLLKEAAQEHAQAKALLEEMKSISPASEEFKAKIRQLNDAVQHHVEEEESEVFDTARECMNGEQLQELGDEFEQAKNKIKHEIVAALSQ